MRTRQNKRNVQPPQSRPRPVAPAPAGEAVPALDLERLLLMGGERIAIKFPENSGEAFMAEFVELY